MTLTIATETLQRTDLDAAESGQRESDANKPALHHRWIRLWQRHVDLDALLTVGARPDKKLSNARNTHLGSGQLKLDALVLKVFRRPIGLNPKCRIISIHMKNSISSERVKAPNL